MLITLAYPHDGHVPGDTIEVGDDLGANMIRDGLARLPDSVEDALGGIAELRDYAAQNDIDLTGLRSKADIAAAIRSAEELRATTPETPPAGADQ